MEKVDLLSKLRNLYTASRHVQEVTADRGTFLCLDGKGQPSGDAFQEALDLLWTVTYLTKANLRKAGRLDFKVPKAECRWLVRDPHKTLSSEWHWQLMLRVPDELSNADLKEARKTLLERNGRDASAVRRLSWREGRALQLMHVGSHDVIDEAYAKLRAKADQLGYRIKGPGHEIYINDPWRAAPNTLKTIVRLPIAWPRPAYAGGPSYQASRGV
jgi:hypothetical protein